MIPPAAMKPALLTGLLVTSIFCLLFFLERKIPLRRRNRALLAHLTLNLAMSLLAFATAAALVRPASLAGLDWSANKPFGLVLLLRVPPILQSIIAFLLMDLTFYWWHVANHRVPFLWRFHNVHH